MGEDHPQFRCFLGRRHRGAVTSQTTVKKEGGRDTEKGAESLENVTI